MAKINSGRKLYDLLKASGTGKDKLAVLDELFPRNKHGEVIKDVHSEILITRLEEIHDEYFANGEEGSPLIPSLTLEKARSIAAVGEYIPQSMYQEDFPVEFEDGEDEDLPPPVSAAPVKKNKGGRPPKVKPPVLSN